jgi:hypothetical protein
VSFGTCTPHKETVKYHACYSKEFSANYIEIYALIGLDEGIWALNRTDITGN